MICPACGFKNSEGEIYCDGCGIQIRMAPGANPEPPESDLKAGAILGGKYRLEEILQEDREAIFALFSTLETEEASARQVMGCQFPSNPQQASEVYAALAEVEHEGLWRIQELVSEEKGNWLVGPPVGQSLGRYLSSREPLQLEEIINIGLDILNALKILHNMCQIFNAISLDGVWIDQEKRAVLTRYDRLQAKYHVQAETGSVLPGFSAPEAYGLEGGELTRRSDIFGVGALLYYLWTQKTVEVGSQVNFSQPPLKTLRQQAFYKVLTKALERSPHIRWLSASEMAEALHKVLNQPDTEIPAGPAPVKLSTYSEFADYQVAKVTDVGVVRKINQDAFLELSLSVCERDRPTTLHFVGVIDGMGGEAEGDKAASLAARAIARELLHLTLPLKNDGATTILLPLDPKERKVFLIERALQAANRTIFEYACKAPRRRGMGCTISCVLLEGAEAVFGHVGDTRGYRMAREMDQVTTDHSIVGQLVQLGTLTREEARRSPKRSIIYRALGTQAEVEVETYDRQIAPGEYIMLSSDGVWEYYSDEELLSYFQKGSEPSLIAKRLVQVCLERGADDNATVAIIRRRPR